MKFAYVVNNHFIGGDKLYCLDKGFPMGDLYRTYSGTFYDRNVFYDTAVQFVTGPRTDKNPKIYLDEGVRNFKVSAEFFYKYSVSTSAMASAFKNAGINSANPTLHGSILCDTFISQNPIIRCESNIPNKPYENLTVVSNDLRIPWSAVSADYMNNIQTQNLTATIKDENVYSAACSGELNYTGTRTMDNFEMEGGQVEFENRAGFVKMKPELTMQTNLYFSPMFDSYSSSPSWTYYSRS